MKLLKWFPMNLQLLAEGGEGGGDAGVSGADAGLQGEGQGLENVVYGKQEPAREAPAPKENKHEEVPPDLDAEFDALIKGKYKDQYGKRVGDTVRERLKGAKETGERLDAVIPILELLSKKHGTKEGDITALIKAIEEDDTYFEKEAMDRNMSVSELKTVRKMERENAGLRRQVQQQRQKEEADKTYGKWVQEADGVKQTYPNFDLQEELKNHQFGELLKSGIDMKSAYQVLHMDDILSSTAKTVEQKLANNLRSRGNRPAENGTRARSSTVVKNDPSMLSDEDIEEVLRRVERGDHISFG